MNKTQFLDQLIRDFKQINESSVVSSDKQPILTNNKNRLKLKEYIKKLQHHKQELVNKLQAIDLQYTDYKEQRLSIASIINREISKMQKSDEDALKETLLAIKKLLDYDQRLIIEIETVFEKQSYYNHSSQQTVNSEELQAASQAFQEFESQSNNLKNKQIDLGSIDFKLLSQKEYIKLVQRGQEQQLDASGQEFFKNEQKINLLLSQQIEEKCNLIQDLQRKVVNYSKYEQLIEEQAQLFDLPPPETFNFTDLSTHLFEHIHKLISSYNMELSEGIERNNELNRQLNEMKIENQSMQEYAYELKNVNQRVLSDSKHRENQFKQKLDDSKQILEEKIKLQNEVTNLLNTSIEIEKENTIYNQTLQQHNHQLKQLQKTNGALYKEVSKLKQDVNDYYQVKIDLEGENDHLCQKIQQMEIEMDQLQKLVQQYQLSIQNMQISQMNENQQLDLSYNEQLDNQRKQSQIYNSQLEQQYQEQVSRLRNNHISELEQKSSQLQEMQQKYNLLYQEYQTFQSETKIKITLLENQKYDYELNQQKVIENYKCQIQEQQQLNLECKSELQSNLIKYNQLQELNQTQQRELDKTLKLIKELQQQSNQDFEQSKSTLQLEYEENLVTLQQEYNTIIEEQQQQISIYQQTISDQKHKLQLFQRQLEQLEFQKQQELLQYKIDFDKKSFQFSKELDQVKDVLTQSVSFKQSKDQEGYYQRLISEIQDNSNQILQQTQFKYEQMIQDLVQQYEKQLTYLQEQIHTQKPLDTSKQSRQSQKPPRIFQRSPNQQTNSPASSIQQSFYREVAKFSKDLDESNNEEIPKKRNTGIVKQQNRHIFIEDEHSSIDNQTPQNFSSNDYNFQRQEICVQTSEGNEEIFPPFDHRICLRCKKNDMIAPNFCKFKEMNQINDLSMSCGSQKQKSSRVMKEHIYGCNLSWRQKDPYSAKKANYFSTFERVTQGMNTILSLVNDQGGIRKNSRSSQKQKRHSESLSISFSSKNDTNRSNQQH